MRKVRWEITNNFKLGKDFKEYDKVTYECKEDDIWITTEIPLDQAIGDKPGLLAHKKDVNNTAKQRGDGKQLR